ncbi:kp-43 peptidase [Serendipita vermifera]|nr:kp-43 peptidase [Serendipita vermifera]
MTIFSINGNRLDPVSQAPVIKNLGLEAADASGSNYILIQTAHCLTLEQKEALKALEVQILKKVSRITYLCSYKPSNLQAIRDLPFIEWADVYNRHFKICSQLKGRENEYSQELPMVAGVTTSEEPQTVDIVFHEDIDGCPEELKSEIATAANIDPASLIVCRRKIRAQVPADKLDEVAGIDSVAAIEQVGKAILCTSKARVILNIPESSSGRGSSIDGTGQVIAVADTGFDEGETKSTHPAFRSSKIAKIYPMGGTAGQDALGHGTHVCASIVGDGVTKTGERVRGTAPGATLVVQALGDSLSGIPDDLYRLFKAPYDADGARIHSNSWTFQSSETAPLPGYGRSEEVDRFVWEHPDMVVLYCAGNFGLDSTARGVVDTESIGVPAAAKNCITVGASENNRPDLQATYGDFDSGKWQASPFKTDRMANNPKGLAAFSSRGPVSGNRIKPDVVAPGTCILSANSQAATGSDSFPPYSDPQWKYMSGTSMATPLVAGCIAPIRATLIARGVQRPPAALIKAILITGADYIAGQYTPSETGKSFNSNSGYGLVNVGNSLACIEQKQYYVGAPLAQGKEQSFTINVPSTATMKVTLVWTDPPGEGLQNNLDLRIVRAGGQTVLGGQIEAGGDVDRVNNVEQAVVTRLPAGPVTVTVHALDITVGTQPYAVAWRFLRA